MAYSRTNWVAHETKATAERMNNIEEGILANEEAAAAGVKYTADQSLTDAQKAMARANIEAGSATDVDNLKSAINDPTTGLNGKAPVIIDTASGSIASFPDGADGVPVKSLTVGIKPVQSGSGDPSPTNVRPISGWTGANVTRTGKNLFDYTDPNNWRIAESSTYRVKTSTSGSIAIQGSVVTLTRTQVVVGFTIILGKLIAGFEYTISFGSFDGTDGFAYIGKLDADVLSDDYYSTRAFTLSIASNKVSFTPSVTGLYEILLWGSGKGSISVSNVQLEFGSSSSEFTPFVANETIPITFPSEAGTVYGGTLTVNDDGTGELVVDRASVDLGTLDWTNGSQMKMFFSTGIRELVSKPADNSVVADIISSAFTPISYNSLTLSAVGRICILASGSIGIVDGETYASVNDLKVAVSGVQLVYKLATPLTYNLTDLEVIETLNGFNNVWADTGDSTVTYRADTKLYIQKINAPTDDDMIADAQIASGKYFIVGGNLYRSTTTIPAGDTIIPGTNCTKTNLAEALNALNT